MLGIDEAGRGAAIGPLVVAGVLVPAGEIGGPFELGARDSKRLSRPRRSGLVRELARHYPARVRVITAREVDGAGLTELELTAARELVGWAQGMVGGHGLRVVMDAPVPPRAIPALSSRLSRLAGLPPKAISAYPKADSSHPAVAAASIFAKVVRDAHVLFLRGRYGDFGWGYPGEQRVEEFLRAWLDRHGKLPPIVRSRWGSVARLLDRELGL